MGKCQILTAAFQGSPRTYNRGASASDRTGILNDVALAPIQLDYAVGRAGWGPVLFRPSVRSLVLIVLVGLATAGVWHRHEPWTFVVRERLHTRDRIDRGAPDPVFVADGLVAVRSGDDWLYLYDAATGRRLRELWHFDSGRSTVSAINKGRRLLVFDESAPHGVVIDPLSGTGVRL